MFILDILLINPKGIQNKRPFNKKSHKKAQCVQVLKKLIIFLLNVIYTHFEFTIINEIF